MAVAAALALIAVLPGGDGTVRPGVEPAQAAPLVRLASQVLAAPAPDATLIVRRHSFPADEGFAGHDLYTDDGRYFYGATEAELRAAVAANRAQDAQTRELLAAAVAGARLEPEAAREKLLAASYRQGFRPDSAPRAEFDNQLWTAALQVLDAGAGRPEVRAGVLRALSTIATVAVTEVAAPRGGRALLLRSGGSSPDELGEAYEERLTLDADTGVPLRFEGGEPGARPDVVVAYAVGRVGRQDFATATR